MTFTIHSLPIDKTRLAFRIDTVKNQYAAIDQSNFMNVDARWKQRREAICVFL